MIGDMIFALLTFPIRVILSWWKKSIFHREATPEPKIESVPAERNNTRPDVSRLYPGLPVQAQPNALQFPRKVSSESTRFGYVRNSSNGSNQNTIQADRWVPKGKVQRVPSNGTPNGLQSHEIWHPPPSSYSDAQDLPDSLPNTRPRHELDKLDLQQRAEVDEWRQYPPFPSAYPPTPIATVSSKLPGNPYRHPQRLPDTTLIEISEDEPEQDFRGSLPPLRKPLNPSYVGLSDDRLPNAGVQNDLFDDKMTVDTDSETTDMDDEEDAFNITLRTPLPSLGSARSHVRDITPVQRPVSFASSAASKSTALSTAGGGSSLRTRSSSESLSSAAVSMISATDSSSAVGKKRPLTREKAVGIKNKIHLINRTPARGSPRRRGILNIPSRRLPHSRRTPQRERVLGENATASEDTISSVGDVDAQKDRTTKRRKIALPHGHIAPSSQLVRRRITRHATLPGSVAQGKSTTPRPRVPSVVSRPSARVRPGLTVQPPGTVEPSDSTRPNPSSSNDHAPEPTTHG
jgi:hypothetical protein